MRTILYVVLLVSFIGYNTLDATWTANEYDMMSDKYGDNKGWVSCGCHEAPTCRQCGLHPHMCNGDCTWNGSGCFLKGRPINITEIILNGEVFGICSSPQQCEKVQVVPPERIYTMHDFKALMEESCHESYSVAEEGFPLLAQIKEFQNYTKDLELEKTRILKENSTWVCGRDSLQKLIKNEKIMQILDLVDFHQWFMEVYGQPKSFSLPWNSTRRSAASSPIEDKFQNKNMTSHRHTRIIGGKPVKPHHKYSFMALLLVTSDDGSEVILCGGSIISPIHILTANHCIISIYTKNYNVFLGGYYYGEGSQQPTVQYLFRSKDADIGILQLKDKIKMGATVSIIDLAQNAKENFVGENFTATGWGETKTANYSDVLMEVDVEVLAKNTPRCTKLLGYSNDDTICAWNPPDKDTCKGDSGGPLFVETDATASGYLQIGVTSYGSIPCGEYGKYVSVAHHKDWISDPNSKKHKKCCFAPGSMVTMEDGSFKNIEELVIGDSFLAANGRLKPEFSKFIGWLHKDEMQPAFYLDIHTKNTSITISPRHLILKKGFHGEEVFVMAKYISRGDSIFVKFPTKDYFQWEPVLRILTKKIIGAYAPLTESGTIVVDNNVASCYAEISSHNLAHSAMAPIRLMPSILEDVNSQWKSGIRSYPLNLFRMAKLIGFINEDEITDGPNKKQSWMNIEVMNILNMELLVLVNYFLLKK